MIYFKLEMRDSMNKKSTTSTFLVGMAIFLFFLSIYLVTPTIYKTIKTKQYDASFEAFKTQLVNTKDLEMSVYEYALENDAIISITNQTTNSTIQTPIYKVVQSLEKKSNITLNNQQIIQIHCQYTFQALSDINAILILLLPILGITTFLGYCLVSVKPTSKKENYNDFYTITEDMLRMKPKARLPLSTKSKNKHDVAANINALYEMLLERNDQLDLKNRDYQMLLETSKENMSSLHENIEKDIQAILVDIKGMLSNQGKYKNHTIYLMEIKMKLENLLNQKEKSQPLPSTVHDIFKTVLKPYEVFLSQKQVNITYQLEKNFKITLDDFLFTQAIAQLMAFVMIQCNEQSTIRIVQNEYDLHLIYQGACLSQESIQQVEQLDENIKGCYRNIKQLGFFVDFSQSDQKDGMQFVFHF